MRFYITVDAEGRGITGPHITREDAAFAMRYTIRDGRRPAQIEAFDLPTFPATEGQGGQP